MDKDELRDRLLRAADPDPTAVCRVVTAALASGAPIRTLTRPRVLAAIATCIAASGALAAWWSIRQPPTPPAGVYRVQAVPAASDGDSAVASSAAPPASGGVYRTTASLSLTPSRIIRVTADDGTTWILSTDSNDDWLPRGSAIVLGGGAAK